MASPIPDLEIVFNFRSILILLTWDDHNRGSLCHQLSNHNFCSANSSANLVTAAPPQQQRTKNRCHPERSEGSQNDASIKNSTTSDKRNASLSANFPRDPNQRIVI